MTHLSLYRRYRPQTFGDVVGQEHVTRTLQRAVEEDRIAHAYLFSGPRGTGKTSTARILAKALNCERKGERPCNECTSCLEITDGSSLDVIEIDAASHGSVDDARDLREKVAYASVGGRWKVYIVDECHMLSPAANNALLKVLEEPPSHVVFVFATTEPHKVLQTLLDRCQRYEFRSIGTPEITAHLVKVCEAEGVAIDEDTAAVVAARAAGSLRDALTLIDQLTAFSSDKIGVDEISQLLGTLPEDLLFDAIDVIAERDVGASFLFTDRLIGAGTDVREFTRALVEHLRSLFLVQHAPSAQEILDVTDEQLERLRVQSNRIDPAEMLRLIDLANEAQLQLRQAVDGRLALEVCFARMTRPDLHATSPSMLSRIERLERLAGIGEEEGTPQIETAPRRVAPPTGAKTPTDSKPPARRSAAAAPSRQPVAATKVPEASPVSEGPIDIDKITRAWPIVMEKVKKRKISLQAFLIPAKPAGWQDGELVLEFRTDSSFHQKNVSDPQQHGPLLEAFNEVFGVKPRLRCVLGSDPPSEQRVSAAAPDLDDVSDSTEGQPPRREAIDLIRETFGGAEVVEEG